MILKQFNGIQWHQFELLADTPVIHGTFMRHGGHSLGTLSSLNMGKSVGDQPENVTKNLLKVQSALNIPQLFSAKLCNGADVMSIDATTNAMTICDAICTQQPQLGLMITHADCQAAIFYDPKNHVIANVHCGWRGNVQNIYQATIEYMKSTYGSNPANLLVCVSPSLGPENSQFLNYKTELPVSFLDFQFKPDYFDLWAISEWQLKNAGIQSNHIEFARINTYTSMDHFSYRRDKVTGRQATICALI